MRIFSPTAEPLSSSRHMKLSAGLMRPCGSSCRSSMGYLGGGGGGGGGGWERAASGAFGLRSESEFWSPCPDGYRWWANGSASALGYCLPLPGGWPSFCGCCWDWFLLARDLGAGFSSGRRTGPCAWSELVVLFSSGDWFVRFWPACSSAPALCYGSEDGRNTCVDAVMICDVVLNQPRGAVPRLSCHRLLNEGPEHGLCEQPSVSVYVVGVDNRLVIGRSF